MSRRTVRVAAATLAGLLLAVGGALLGAESASASFPITSPR